MILPLKRLVVGVAVSALCAGPALAQGTFSHGPPKSSWSPSAPVAKAAPVYTPPKPKPYAPPETPKPFKPYEPYKSNNGTSVFGPDGKPKH